MRHRSTDQEVCQQGCKGAKGKDKRLLDSVATVLASLVTKKLADQPVGAAGSEIQECGMRRVYKSVRKLGELHLQVSKDASVRKYSSMVASPRPHMCFLSVYVLEKPFYHHRLICLSAPFLLAKILLPTLSNNLVISYCNSLDRVVFVEILVDKQMSS
ncbi:hypothetical protein L7F22_017015 [Adiantum nelumboides]|nr:hypothetical protein [Adiantum nelumboides]